MSSLFHRTVIELSTKWGTRYLLFVSKLNLAGPDRLVGEYPSNYMVTALASAFVLSGRRAPSR